MVAFARSRPSAVVPSLYARVDSGCAHASDRGSSRAARGQRDETQVDELARDAVALQSWGVAGPASGASDVPALAQAMAYSWAVLVH